MASPRWTYGADSWLVFSAAGSSEGGAWVARRNAAKVGSEV